MPSPGPTDPLPSSFDADQNYLETPFQRLKRRILEEPLVPLGALITSWVLYRASRSIRQKDKHGAQVWFRRRIYAQGLTVAAMMAGSFYFAEERGKRKELEKLAREEKAKERRDRWLQELEIREKEEEQLREAEKRLRERAKGRGL